MSDTKAFGLTIKDYGDAAPADGSREAFEAKHGRVWDTKELQDNFEVLGFSAPFVVVREKHTGKKGSLEFCHSPRYYFNLREE